MYVFFVLINNVLNFDVGGCDSVILFWYYLDAKVGGVFGLDEKDDRVFLLDTFDHLVEMAKVKAQIEGVGRSKLVKLGVLCPL